MAVFKCKMCGGALTVHDTPVVTCEYCGTTQTLPKLNSDQRENLYNLANNYRLNNDFDKAADIYEQILKEDSSDAEAHWSLVLCRYGIEYVEDPLTHKRVPTVNRAQYTSVFDDINYRSALDHADICSRTIYQEEAQAINEIQKGILAISRKEAPFDIFICYKETDNNGRRTPDSVLANDLYHQLTQEGFKVFFARITLEDKLGSAYEPYIFAALNSAKVMVVLGTKPEYFQAVWVRNEWSRYLSLIRHGEKKILIPAYRDMDPYHLPEEFSHLQALDMAKLGFMQDLIRGIKKLTGTDAAGVSSSGSSISGGDSGNAGGNAVSIDALLTRVSLFLVDGDWGQADAYCERVLDMDPQNPRAYLGKLMAQLRVKTQKDLSDCKEPFDTNSNYQKVLMFADSELKQFLIDCTNHIKQQEQEDAYNQAVSMMNNAKTEAAFKTVAHVFENFGDYKLSATHACTCYEKAEEIRQDAIYNEGKSRMERGGGFTFDYEKAVELFESISGWKDADQKANECREKIETLKEELKAKRQAKAEKKANRRAKCKRIFRKIGKISLITTISAAVVTGIILLLIYVIIPSVRYNNAKTALNAGRYEEAIATFEALGDYKDSDSKSDYAYQLYKANKLQYAKIGDTVYFGTSTNYLFDYVVHLEWLVLDIQDGKALVVSKYAIGAMAYDNDGSSSDDSNWEDSTIRFYLNGSFFEDSFSLEEKTMIPTVALDTGTEDQVFLLSQNEVLRYFPSYSTRQCTVHKANYWVKHAGDDPQWWWLRTASSDSRVMCVKSDGSFGSVQADDYGGYDERYWTWVRPAMWIDLNG